MGASGGRIRRGEAPHEAALRELEEETTLTATELTYLFQFSGFNTLHYVFFAEVVHQSIAQETFVIGAQVRRNSEPSRYRCRLS